MDDKEIQLSTVEDLIAELKRRNISFVLAWADHEQFVPGGTTEQIAWGCDSGGSFVLVDTLRRFLNRWLDQEIDQRTAPDP